MSLPVLSMLEPPVASPFTLRSPATDHRPRSDTPTPLAGVSSEGWATTCADATLDASAAREASAALDALRLPTEPLYDALATGATVRELLATIAAQARVIALVREAEVLGAIVLPAEIAAAVAGGVALAPAIFGARPPSA